MKKQSGITLVALVITIIVLLILAGVSISLVMGNNGVLTQASSAVIENKKADVREAVSMALAATETIYYGKWTANTSITRDSVYADTAVGFAKQLENLGYTTNTLSGVPPTGDITVTKGTDTFTVSLSNTNGTVTITEVK